MNNENDDLLSKSLDLVTVPFDLRNIEIELGNKGFINIVQLTNNNYDDYFDDLQISGNNVVWSAFDGNDREIFLYDGNNTLQLTNNYTDDYGPQISGNKVVWYGYDATDYDVYLYDDNSIIQLTNNYPSSYYHKAGWIPQISGNNVTWLRTFSSSFPYNVNPAIFLYDGNNTIQLVNNDRSDISSLKISGNTVAWIEEANGIFLYEDNNIIQLSDNPPEDHEIQISGDNVVWMDKYNRDISENGIFLYDGNNTIQLSNQGFRPQISGNNVVWEEHDEIFLYDGNNIVELSADGDYPQISGNNVVWEEFNEIFLYNGNKKIQLTNNDEADVKPKISGDKIVWVSHNNYETYNIFLADLPLELSQGETIPVKLSSSIFINNLTVLEGNENQTNVTFTVSLAEASNKTITVDYSTFDGTADSGKDYIATHGTLEFVPGETEKEITVEIIGDLKVEETEIFTVDLSNATNALLIDGQGSGVIENDDIPEKGIINIYGLNHRYDGYFTGDIPPYIYVAATEKNDILANHNFSQTFEIERNGNYAFKANLEPQDDLLPFFRLKNIDVYRGFRSYGGTYLYVSTEEYDSIFAEDSDQKDRWIKEGLDAEGIDIPEFYLYGVGANQGIEFHRFQHISNHTFFFASPEETEAIYRDPLLSESYIDQGIAFESFI
ncbi:Calx-beta domain-containing protein [Xenococcus sp. PCC 7305]|uniref:Calx-beta domain-containing protein n=1 Tax=Xenococcus sp. PCC 7305 TaxID=102125 RepID=UPI0002ABC964|nr:Calx-beta domain-containing protein [Xenococcus sp. PCC 7305]ELS03461.1 Calx-beta domain-containing protein [Xenococcus sp. PCC 7305]